jgi:hypothetical protein
VSEFIFTFGFSHTDPVSGASRAKKFCRIEAADYESARQRMNNTYGRQWAFEYESEEEAGVAKWGLTEVTGSSLPPELAAILAEVYKPEGIRIWWGAEHKLLSNERAVDVWRTDPARVIQVAEQLLGQVAT